MVTNSARCQWLMLWDLRHIKCFEHHYMPYCRKKILSNFNLEKETSDQPERAKLHGCTNQIATHCPAWMDPEFLLIKCVCVFGWGKYILMVISPPSCTWFTLLCISVPRRCRDRRIELKKGKTVSVSAYHLVFMLQKERVKEAFYRKCCLMSVFMSLVQSEKMCM